MATTIAQLEADVIDALQGRTDITSATLDKYIQRALQEITENYPFEELRTTGPQFVLTTGQAAYAVTSFTNTYVPGGGGGTSHDDYTLMPAFTVFVDVGTNQVPSTMKYRTVGAIRSITGGATLGVPTFWSRLGSNFVFGPVPNSTYTAFMDYQRKHPFDEAASLGAQTIYVPDSWLEIVSYTAAMRLAIIKRWNDQAKTLHDILFGDPEYVASEGKRGRPGLLAARQFQIERDQRHSNRQLGIVQSRYSR